MASQPRVDLLQCSICFERKDRRNPRMLVCQHSFCQGCLLAWHAEHPGRKRYIECPMCREGTQIPSGGIQSLPLDFRLEEVATILKGSVKKAYCQPCSYRSKECLVTAICKTCSGRFCKTCADEHISSDLFSKHRIVAELCAEHVSYIDYMCLTCMQGICVECCWSEQHEGHKLVDKVQGKTEIKARCSKMQTSIRETLSNLECELQIKSRQYKDHHDKVEQQLRLDGEKLKEKIDETIQECIDKHKRKHMDILNDFNKEYWFACRKGQEAFQSAERAFQELTKMSPGDLFSLQSSLESSIDLSNELTESLQKLQPTALSSECCSWVGTKAVYETLEECEIKCDIGNILSRSDPAVLTELLVIDCADRAGVITPTGLDVMSDGSAIVGEFQGQSLYRIHRDGRQELIYKFLTGAAGAFCVHGEDVFIAQADGINLIKCSPGKGVDIITWTPPMPSPISVVVDEGHVYVLHEKGILRESLSGNERKEIVKGAAFRSFIRVHVDGSPRNIVTMSDSSRCNVYSDNGDLLHSFDRPDDDEVVLDCRNPITRTADGNLLIVHWEDRKIKEYTVDGTFLKNMDLPGHIYAVEVSYRYPYLWVVEDDIYSTDGYALIKLYKLD